MKCGDYMDVFCFVPLKCVHLNIPIHQMMDDDQAPKYGLK